MDWATSSPSTSFNRPATGTSTPSYSGSSTPLSASFTSSGGGFLSGHHGPGTGSASPAIHTQPPAQHHANSYHSHQAHNNHHHHQPLPQLDIQLDSEEILLRGAGSDYNPALLSGRVVLNLQESTNIREISMRLEGKAKVVFHEGGT